MAYGIRYEFGIFHQAIVDGWQVEKTDKWLRVRWVPRKIVNGAPYDTPILGYRNNTANNLRLWRAEAPESFDFAVFNSGDYYGAVNQKITSENLSKVLYPNDEQIRGKELRLEQQYFFVSCSLLDMLRILRGQKLALGQFHQKFAVQLNDTHPAIAIAELMRLLIDDHCLSWDEAWAVTCRTFAYTNHTLLPEALECWALEVFARVLPRHFEIIYEINARFLDEVRIRFLGDEERIARMSIIDERGGRYVRMAHLACVGSHAINGVAELHSELLKSDLLKDFYALSPHNFTNKTNGVTPRRWTVLSNPRLTTLISQRIGDQWIKDLERLRELEPLVDEANFREQWWEIKQANKRALATLTTKQTGTLTDPDSMFDVLVKRIHEYKRQHLDARSLRPEGQRIFLSRRSGIVSSSDRQSVESRSIPGDGGFRLIH